MSILTDRWLDIVALLVIVFSIWHGWRTGFIVGLFNLLSIPAGLLVAWLFAPNIAAATNISLTYMYPIIFFVTIFLVHFLGHRLRNFFRRRIKIISGTDAFLGAIVGGAKAWLLLVLFLVVWGGSLNSSAVRNIACGANTAGSLVSKNVNIASTLGTWQADYNLAVSNSAFASLNSFIVPQHVTVQPCGSNSAGN